MLGLCHRQLAKLGFAKQLHRGFAISKEGFLGGDNAVYAEQMYQNWKKDPKSVHSSWNAYFTNLEKGVQANSAYVEPPFDGLPPMYLRHKITPETAEGQKAAKSATPTTITSDIQSQWKVYRMIEEYRRRGHRGANLDPLKVEENKLKVDDPFFTLEQNTQKYGFTKDELSKPVSLPWDNGMFSSKASWTPQEVAKKLEEVYTGPIGFEYMHIPDAEAVAWIQSQIESGSITKQSNQEKEYLLDRIIYSQAFSDILEVKYSSSKRYGAEGCDSGITGMEFIADVAQEKGVEHLYLGMPHRGRFNIMAGMFRKPVETIFTAFNDLGAETEARAYEWGYSSDVKYHMEAHTVRKSQGRKPLNMVSFDSNRHFFQIQVTLKQLTQLLSERREPSKI